MEVQTLTHTKTGPIMKIGKVAYLLVSVGQIPWQAKKPYFRESAERNVALDFGEIENESINNYIRDHL